MGWFDCIQSHTVTETALQPWVWFGGAWEHFGRGVLHQKRFLKWNQSISSTKAPRTHKHLPHHQSSPNAFLFFFFQLSENNLFVNKHSQSLCNIRLDLMAVWIELKLAKALVIKWEFHFHPGWSPMGPQVASKAVQCETNSRQQQKKTLHTCRCAHYKCQKVAHNQILPNRLHHPFLATTCAAATQPESNVALIATHLLPQLPILTRANRIAALGQKATPHQCVKTQQS